MNQIKILKTIWIISHIGTLLCVLFFPIDILLIGILVGLTLHMLGQGISLHRYFSHRSFKTYRIVDIFLTFITIPCSLGSPISWAAVHRYHHRVSDTKLDVQSPTHNAWHDIWFCNYLGTAAGLNLIKDLLRDRFQVWIHKNYTNLLICWILFVSCFGFKLLSMLVFIPIVVTYTLTMLGSIVVHKWGYQNHETTDFSKNSLIISLFTFGDGWHNNHHAEPSKYQHGERWFEFDLLSYIIRLIKIN